MRLTMSDRDAPRDRRGPIARGALIGIMVLALAGVTWVVGVRLIESGSSSDHGEPAALCRVQVGSMRFALTPAQAEHATTIAAVGKRMGMPDRAVTVALAAALQESSLRNLDYGDQDSLGLFQQRPSQGWGSPAEILTPSYAAEAFFEHLARVDGWESASVTVAAQAVQRSALPSAYASWEPRAQVLTQATTGGVAAALRCQFLHAGSVAPMLTLEQAIANELGSPALGTSLAPARGWTVAAWLVAHAYSYHITSVTFAGRTWTSATGSWNGRAPFDAVVHYTTA
jgi:hypothetical protein